MKRIALISDIHGNAGALEAVLDDLADRHVDELVCLGDVAAVGPQPCEALARLRELGCPTVLGNADGWLLEGLPREPEQEEGEIDRLKAIVEWARTQLSSADREFLRSFTRAFELELEGATLLCFHGSPRSAERYLAAGFTAVKIKVGGAPLADDLRRIETVLEIVAEPTRLAVDANGRFDLETALEYARALAPYQLRWYEEPVDPLDLAAHGEVAAAYPEPLATGKNLFAAIDVENLLRFAALRPELDILQMDPGLAYGLTEYIRIVELLAEHGWTPRSVIPHGGHLFALHVAAGLGLGGCEAYPELFDPIGTFGADVEISDGLATLPETHGIGLERIDGFAAAAALAQ